ncbi:MAG: tripartite tricarboxylate transporter substrate binding protein [Betaproteobacteria bacterium]|nr:tripartite tricarboxylate transporter substrate binding protein [Betaproteobacteria bacterium]
MDWLLSRTARDAKALGRPAALIRSYFMTAMMRCVIALTAAVVAGHAIAADFPVKPVRLIVPFPPGGTIDVVARLIGDKLRTTWTQPVIVENRVGGNGTLAVDHVAKSAPDGHTLLVHAFLLVTVPHLQRTPYDVTRDLVGVTQTLATAYALAATTKSGFTSWDDVIAAARKDPKRLNYGSGGNGSAQHLFVEMAANAARIELTHVPYKGNGPAQQAFLSGEIDLMFDPTNTVIPLVKSGRARALLVSGDRELAGLPGTPPLGRVYGGLGIDGWHGIYAPAATPKPIVDQISSAVRGAVLSPELSARFRDMGFEAVGLESTAFNELIRRDFERWGKVIRDNNIRAD